MALIKTTTASQRFFQKLELQKEIYFKKKINLGIYNNADDYNMVSEYRSKYIDNYMLPLLDDESLNKIVSFIKGTNVDKILEVCAGSGLLAALLLSLLTDVTIITTDITEQYRVWEYRDNAIKLLRGKSNVEVLDSVNAVVKYETDMLLCCWPFPNTLLPCVGIFKGTYIIYIGEPDPGCCESEMFFDEINELFNCIKTITIPTFYTYHDVCLVYKRK